MSAINKLTMDQLDELAQEIGAKGVETDTTVGALQKGVTDALSVIRDLVALRKGDDGDEDDEDGDEDDEDAEDAEDEPGYEDMQLGSELDVTAFFTDTLPAWMKRLEKGQKAILKRQADIEATQAVLAKAVEADLGLSIPLTKAVTDLHARIEAIPEPVVRTGLAGAGRVRHTAPPVKVEDADGVLTKRQLVKGMQEQVIDFEQVQRYQRLGRFSDDEETHKRIRTSVVNAGK